MRWKTARRWVLAPLCALLTASACSTFTSADASGTDDGGGVDATADGAPPNSDGADHPCDPTMLAVDSNNCGKCGHSCLRGACSQGQCQPLTLASLDTQTIVDLRLEPDRVLWTTTTDQPFGSPGNVYGCAKDGCETPTAFLANPTIIGSLSTDPARVDRSYVSFFYVDTGFRQFGDGGLGATLPNGLHAPAHMQGSPDDGTLYFIDLYEDGGSTVMSWKPAAPAAAPIVKQPGNARDFAYANGRAYVADENHIYVAPANIPSSTMELFRTSPVLSLVSDGATIFWVSDATVLSCPATDTCEAPSPLLEITSPDAPATLTVYQSTLLVGTVLGDIFVCPTTGCPADQKPVVHAARLFDETKAYAAYIFGHPIAADETAIYYTTGQADNAGHSLMKLAR